jgi:diguanylate cyclase
MSMLMSRADAALYEAKVTGRNRTAIHGDPGRAARELEAATQAGELRVHYQRIVRLDTGDTVGYEALIRWQHPQRGLLAPSGFIPDAERSGAIHAIGQWLIQQVIADIAAHPGSMLRVGINVSVRELQRADYADTVIGCLRRSGINGSALVVEITESALADSDEAVHRTLQRLRDHGVMVAIDDLGAGYSSLRRIQALPIDFIKLDGSMMRMIPEQGDRAPILEALVSMGNSLGVRMVAEWVETPHQAQVLRTQGYFLGQGYLFGKPLPLEELFAD